MNELIEKLKHNKTAFGLLELEDKECFVKVGKSNCQSYYKGGWQNTSGSEFYCNVTYRIKSDYQPETAGDPGIIYICQNCKRERFTITIYPHAGTGMTIGPYINQRLGLGLVTKGILKIECECGLKTTFNWNKAKVIDFGPCGRN